MRPRSGRVWEEHRGQVGAKSLKPLSVQSGGHQSFYQEVQKEELASGQPAECWTDWRREDSTAGCHRAQRKRGLGGQPGEHVSNPDLGQKGGLHNTSGAEEEKRKEESRIKTGRLTA